MVQLSEQNILLVPNFISEDDCREWIRVIDSFMLDTGLVVKTSNVLKRDVIPFGIDYKDPSNSTLDLIPEHQKKIEKLSDNVIGFVKKFFNNSDTLYLTSFWFSRQHPGSFIEEHEDTDDGWNTQNSYSGIIYLNTLKDSGEIIFNDAGYSKFPQAGDLILFDSKQAGMHQVAENYEMRYTMPLWITKDSKFALC